MNDLGTNIARTRRIPELLRRQAEMYWQENGKNWLQRLSLRLDRKLSEWDLTFERTFDTSSTALVALVRQRDGSPAVLKIAHPLLRGEAEALVAYGSTRAVTVYRFDEDAMLLEFCRTEDVSREPISDSDVFDLTLDIMRELWSVPPWRGVNVLAQQCETFFHLGIAALRIRPDLDCAEYQYGLELLHELEHSAPRRVLLHGDLHAGNILSCPRRSWLVIDPKPLVGDPAYEPIQAILQLHSQSKRPDDPLALAEYVARAGERLDVPALRIARWGYARRTDWALFCDYRNEPLQAAAARRDMRLFKRAIDEFS